MAGRFSISATFSALDQITGPVRRMQARMQKFTEGAERQSKRLKSLDEGLGRIRSGFAKVGAAAVVGGAIAGSVMVDVVKTGMQFEQTLTNAAAKFPGQIRRGTDEFAALEEAAKRVGGTTEFTASQSAEALNFLAMAGFNVEQSIAALPGVVDLATAAQVELGEATDIATDSLGAFGLATKDPIQLSTNLTRINDVLARTTTTANTNMVDMFEAIKEGAPVATSAGASIETFSALVGELANSGIKGSVAGTTLKNVFLRLAAPVGAAAASLKNLGVKTKDSQGNLRDVVDILGDLNKGLEGMGTADRARVLNDIFGKIPLAGVNVLLQSGSDRLREYRTQLEGAGGAASQMAATMRDTTLGQLKGLESATEALKLELFDVVSGPLRETITGLTDWARANKDVIKTKLVEWLKALPGIIDRLARIGVLVGAFYAFSTAVKVAAVATKLFTLALAANPFTLIAVAIAGVIALLYLFWPEITAFFKEFWDSLTYWFGEMLMPAIQPGIDAVVDLFGAAVDVINGYWVIAREFWMGVWNSAAPFFENLWSSVTGALRAAWDTVGPYFQAIWDGITTVASAAFDGLSWLAMHYVDYLKEVFGTLTSFFTSLWDGIRAGFEAFFGPIVAAVGGFSDMVSTAGASGQAPGAPGAPGGGPQIISREERVARSVTETTNSSTSELTIRDETGRAEITKKPRGKAHAMRLAPSGAV